MGCNSSSKSHGNINAKEPQNTQEDYIIKSFVYMLYRNTNELEVGKQSYIIIQPLGIFGEDSFNVYIDYGCFEGYVSIAFENKIFFSGGKSSEISKEVKEITISFSKNSGILRYLCDMIYPRHYHCLVAILSKYVYAISGVSTIEKHEELTTTCEKYDIRNDSWTAIAPLKNKRANFAACSLEYSYIFVFGGRGNEFSNINAIECYSIDSDGWEIISLNKKTQSIWKGNTNIGATEIDKNKIIILGGRDSDGRDIYEYNNSLKEINKIEISNSSIKSSLSILNNQTISTYNGRIYCTNSKGNVFIYTIQGENWKEINLNK